MQDPREKNQTFNVTSASLYVNEYATALAHSLQQVSSAAIDRACILILEAAQAGKHIFVAGNGGSAAIADHLCCDWTKGTYHPNKFRLKTTSLVANTPLLTAIANDIGYSKSFSAQIEMLGQKGDILVLISSSGASENIKNAMAAAKGMGIKVIGLSGFDGGVLKKEADLSLHVPFNNYGIVEDAHQALMHVISQYVALKMSPTKF